MERNEIMEKVTSVFRDVFDNEELVITDSTTAADIEDWDSLTHITLISAIEDELGYKFDDGELTEVSPENNKVSYKFAFKIEGNEVASMIWDGYYPKFVRDKIDLSNKRGKFENEDPNRLSFEQYLLYKMVKGKSDLIYGIIMHICNACSYSDSEYTTDPNEIMAKWNNSRKCDAFRVI
jgi:acyl carrier protein